MSETTYRAAVTRGLADALRADEDVFVIGEDVGAAGGVFKVTDGLFEEFGPERVLDTPISEVAIVGAAIGAAVHGLRPVVEIMFADFAGVCFDQIANQLPKYRYMTGGQVQLPVVIRLVGGAGGGFGAQHSQAVENWFLNVPGLKIAVPATPSDAYGLLRSAIDDPNPVLFFEHKSLYNNKGELADDPAPVPLGRADVVRSGDAATVVATHMMRHRAVEAAEALAAEGHEIEVLDPRTLAPLDLEAVVESVRRTNRLVVVQESPRAGSWGASLIADVLEREIEMLDAPPVLIATDATPTPYSEVLEAAWMPSAERIAEKLREVLAW